MFLYNACNSKISQKVLTQQLNSLIDEEIVVKDDNHSFPRVIT